MDYFIDFVRLQCIAHLQKVILKGNRAMSQVEKAKDRLYAGEGLRASNLKLFPGSVREITPEELAEQINKAVAQIEAGDYDVVE
jgi:hypothetical protein